MSKKRPGVAAAVRLQQKLTAADISLWERVESQFADAGGSVTKALETGADSICQGATYLTKSQLLKLVEWKFSVGKPRHALKKYLASNSEQDVNKWTRSGIAKAHNALSTNELSVKEALQEVIKLQGVGPATASALLCRTNPAAFCYMYDQVIDAFEPKRDYSLAVYLRVNRECSRIAQTLGEKWTSARVARVLWVAAKVLAGGTMEDLTITSDTHNQEINSGSKRLVKESTPRAAIRPKRART
ncbi:predicted protein [Phaeodactylum tricornutum CCAP 1055/1]|uniref:HhH-GPD domain-containing protein n=1 Tax=Phaeodactylum tricornutum (strain CCAP 1055/1) TaxID=556484 RepID=B7G9K2_PHATC|nr:predicted protein [Phaeodactylum tricornutum CCAP 1055/1]EEC44970.1 predicted protein [Phaeodactylum tricornutum CCAP 1055/1]|eukprot:XP_002183788.1 predicted protein [Phaeodactylum tricornutum CCAP 1055/1]